MSIIHTIYGAEGDHDTPYMTRVVLGRLRLHIFWRGDQDPDPHDHPWGFWTFPLTTYEEEVWRGPEDTQWLTDFLGLDPGIVKTHEVVKAWRIHYRPATHTHRVIGRISDTEQWDPDGYYVASSTPARWHNVPGPVVTIVWTEKVSRKWGFLKLRDGRFCWEPWRDYIFGGGKSAPCEPIEDAKDD